MSGKGIVRFDILIEIVGVNNSKNCLDQLEELGEI